MHSDAPNAGAATPFFVERNLVALVGRLLTPVDAMREELQRVEPTALSSDSVGLLWQVTVQVLDALGIYLTDLEGIPSLPAEDQRTQPRLIGFARELLDWYARHMGGAILRIERSLGSAEWKGATDALTTLKLVMELVHPDLEQQRRPGIRLRLITDNTLKERVFRAPTLLDEQTELIALRDRLRQHTGTAGPGADYTRLRSRFVDIARTDPIWSREIAIVAPDLANDAEVAVVQVAAAMLERWAGFTVEAINPSDEGDITDDDLF